MHKMAEILILHFKRDFQPIFAARAHATQPFYFRSELLKLRCMQKLSKKRKTSIN